MRGPRYGVDGWPYFVGFAVASFGSLSAALLRRGRLGAVLTVAGGAAAVPLVLGGRYVLVGKLELRDRLLDTVDWTGAETVVDLGAGAGLLAVGAAGRTTGPVYAVDLFVGKDLSGNSEARLRANLVAGGVADRVQVLRRDVVDTGLADGSIDVVLSSLCLHNLPTAELRRRALDEIVRLLAPGGRLALSDLAHVDEEYAPHLRAAGLVDISTARAPRTFPPQRTLVARKPTVD